MTHAKPLPADERRAATVEAVVALAADHNPGDITTAAIARQMNLTQGAVFRHFPSKGAIWLAVMEWVADRLMSQLERAAEGLASPLEKMRAMFMSNVEFVAKHPGVPRMIFSELQRAEETPAKDMVRTLVQRYRTRLIRLIEAGKACGELAEDLDSEAAAVLFIGAIQGLVMQSLIAGDVARIRQDAPRAYAIFQRGVGRRP